MPATNCDGQSPIFCATAYTSCGLLFKESTYRVLYFFAGQYVVVVSHGLVKEAVVPSAEINRALERKRRFEAAPENHTYKGK
jgi:hypothetical protein